MMSASRSVALLMVAAVLTALVEPIAVSAQGKTCGQIAQAFNEQTQAFLADADQQNIEFIHKDIFKDYSGTLSNALSSQRFDDLKDNWDEVQKVKEEFNTIYLCAQPGSPCFKSVREKLSDKVKAWFDSKTAGLGLNAVRDRALEAMNLIQGYTDRVMKISTDTMTAMAQCATPMRGQPRLTLNSVPPVEDTTGTATAVVSAPPKSGGGAAKTLLGALGIGVAVGGGLYAYNVYKTTQEETAALLDDISRLPTTNTTTTTSSNATYAATVTRRQCSVGAANANPLSAGFIEPCNSATAGGTCGPTSFTISVSGTAASDCGGWLRNAQVTGTSITALYTGVCGAGGITVSGTLGGSVAGTGTCRGNTYTVEMTTTRQ